MKKGVVKFIIVGIVVLGALVVGSRTKEFDAKGLNYTKIGDVNKIELYRENRLFSTAYIYMNEENGNMYVDRKGDITEIILEVEKLGATSNDIKELYQCIKEDNKIKKEVHIVMALGVGLFVYGEIKERKRKRDKEVRISRAKKRAMYYELQEREREQRKEFEECLRSIGRKTA